MTDTPNKTLSSALDDSHPSRFKPGKSGNPRGRPRKVHKQVKYMNHFRKLMIKNMNQPVKLAIDGKMAEVPAFEAVLQRLLQKALNGKTNAPLRQYVELCAICMRAQEAWEFRTAELLMGHYSETPSESMEPISGKEPIVFK